MKTLLWGVLWIVGACWFVHYLMGNPLDELALIRGAHTSPGFIVDTWEDWEDGRSYSAYKYEFQLSDGREYSQWSREYFGRLKDEFFDLKEPHPIEVEYLPDKPTVSRIGGNGCRSVMEWLWRKVGLGGLLLALFVSPGFVLIQNGFRDLKKLRIAK